MALGPFELLAHHLGMPARLLSDVAILDRLTAECTHPSFLVIVSERFVVLLGDRQAFTRRLQIDHHRAKLALDPLRHDSLAKHGSSLGTRSKGPLWRQPDSAPEVWR
jgi:hypothetical protein